MLSYILGLINDYHRKHGRLPRLVCLNHTHMKALKSEHPEIFKKEQWPTLGFRILIFTDYELPQPRVVWFPTLKNHRLYSLLNKFPKYNKKEPHFLEKKNRKGNGGIKS